MPTSSRSVVLPTGQDLLRVPMELRILPASRAYCSPSSSRWDSLWQWSFSRRIFPPSARVWHERGLLRSHSVQQHTWRVLWLAVVLFWEERHCNVMLLIVKL